MNPGSSCDKGNWGMRDVEEVQRELERICAGSAFRTSKRSCEFLRHIVARQLEGSGDALKERSIGVELLGRESSYDTGSDASVRVRANEVRRRLLAHYQEMPPGGRFRIDLPTGTYSPRFEPNIVVTAILPAETIANSFLETVAEPSIVPIELPASVTGRIAIPELSLGHRCLPILIALFLCAVCLRVQLVAHERFDSFWSRLTDSKRLLIEFPDQADGALSPSDRLRLLAPLLATAGRFNVSAQIATEREAASLDGGSVILTITQRVPTSDEGVNITEKGTGRYLGSLTIVPGKPVKLRLEGTGYDALYAVIAQLTNADLFPQDLKPLNAAAASHSLVLFRDSTGTGTSVQVTP